MNTTTEIDILIGKPDTLQDVSSDFKRKTSKLNPQLILISTEMGILINMHVLRWMASALEFKKKVNIAFLAAEWKLKTSRIHQLLVCYKAHPITKVC